MADAPRPTGHLLVTGVARSGTTALGKLLNTHPDICVGIERFKFQYLRAHVYADGFFERDRFFDFRAEDTNLSPTRRPAWKPSYDEMARKWDTAQIVGDKVPDMAPVLADYMAANPQAQVICVLRNLKDVALSWQTRANKTSDSWPSGKGFVKACESWGEQHIIMTDIMRDKALRRRILLLDYDVMYQEPDRASDAVMGFLDVRDDSAFRAQMNEDAAFFESRTSRRVPKRFAEAYRAIDQSHARGLRKIAREQLGVFADAFAAGPAA